MAVGDIVPSDWTVDRTTGDIRYTGDDHGGGSPSYSTVIKFHRWLQALADDAVASAASGDELDITNTDPSRRSTDNIITLINGYNITDVEMEHLYDGSIIQDDGDTIYDGIVNFGNTSVQIQLIQNGQVLPDDWWNFGGGGLNANAAAGISHRFMIKVRTGGADIDGRRIIGTCRRFGYTYSEFTINGTARGNNVLALTDASDLNNDTIIATVSGWSTEIQNLTEGYIGLDVNNDTTDEYYYAQWDRGAQSINDLYEYAKSLTRDGSGATLYGLHGELFRGITHQVSVEQKTGTFQEPEPITWGTGDTAGAGQMFAIDDTGAGTTLWMQLLTGVIPASGLTITGGESTATASGLAVLARTISKPFVGSSTGTAIIGSYGLGIQVTDLTSQDKVTSLADAVITPPNYVQNTVGGLTAGESRVLVAPWDGVTRDTNNDPAIDKDQLSLSGTLNTADVATIVVAEAIPSDTPAEGWIRVTDDNGFERRLHYSSWATSTFTLGGEDYPDGNEDFDVVNATSGNDVYIAYIDDIAAGTTISFTSVQSGTRNLVVIVRDGGGTPVKQFISEWTQTSSPQTISAILTTDA